MGVAPTPGTQRESPCTVSCQLSEDSVQVASLRDLAVGNNKAAYRRPTHSAVLLLSEQAISC